MLCYFLIQFAPDILDNLIKRTDNATFNESHDNWTFLFWSSTFSRSAVLLRFPATRNQRDYRVRCEFWWTSIIEKLMVDIHQNSHIFGIKVKSRWLRVAGKRSKRCVCCILATKGHHLRIFWPTEMLTSNESIPRSRNRFFSGII